VLQFSYDLLAMCVVECIHLYFMSCILPSQRITWRRTGCPGSWQCVQWPFWCCLCPSGWP